MYHDHKVIALIPAAGSGIRMGSGVRKQYLTLNGKEILNWTLIHLMNDELIDEAIVIVPEEDVEQVEEKLVLWFSDGNMRNRLSVISGGNTRQESVFNGLKAIEGKCRYVIVHDGVRPFVPSRLMVPFIDMLNGDAEVSGVIAGFPITDTLKQVDANRIIRSTVDRDFVWSVQTPQIFIYEHLYNAHILAKRQGRVVTDDAAILELSGLKTLIAEGTAENIKITKPFDLTLAEAIFNRYEF